MISLNITSQRGPIAVKFNNWKQLSTILERQRFFDAFESETEFEQELTTHYQEYWDLYGQYYDRYNNPTVLDIGSGVGIIDLLACDFFKSGTFYLLDKNQNSTIRPNGEYYSRNHGFYNSWQPTVDGIKTSGFNTDQFKIIEPGYEERVPKCDIITSYSSWCWHYPLDIYFTFVLDRLKIGGTLILNISNNALAEQENLIDEISSQLGAEPEKVMYFTNDSKQDPNWIIKDGNRGRACIWTRAS
jgi:SAM-dependent methyltransferase